VCIALSPSARTALITIVFDRILSMLAHIAWASPIVMKLSFLTKHVLKFRKFAIDASLNRIRHGSLTKDLWYYLVSLRSKPPRTKQSFDIFFSITSLLSSIQSDEANLEASPPPRSDVVSDGALAMVAGSDTTAVGISSLLYLLLAHPDKYRRLQVEIDTVFPKDEDDLAAMDSARHGRMVYLNACLYVLSRSSHSCMCIFLGLRPT
jgi:hypothetical protein